MAARLFIRDDDVTTLDKSFRSFFDLAMTYRIPVVYAVIPGRTEKSLVRMLLRHKERTPELLDIVQHGWKHTNHSDVADRKYEFGAFREYEAQHEDMEKGRKRMLSLFGKSFVSAFVPPYHGYDERTLKIVQDLGFRIFSAGKKVTQRERSFLDIPASLSFSVYAKDAPVSTVSCSLMLKRVSVGLLARKIVGVVCHHADFSSRTARRELELFFCCISRLRNRGELRLVLFSDLLNSVKNRGALNRCRILS